MYSDFNFTKIYLMLGGACDFHCRHCLQHDTHNSIKKHPSAETIRFIQHLANIRPRGIRGIPGKVSVVFFGGEPLLYADAIAETIDQVARDNIRWSVITNGSRLSDSMVDFLNTRHIHVALSNDGAETAKIRDKNFLDDPDFCARFARLESRSICLTLHAYSHDLYKNWDYLAARVGNIPISYERLVLSWDMPKDIYAYDLAAWKNTCAAVVDKLLTAWKASNENLSGLREAEFINPYVNNVLTFMRGKAEYPACTAYRKNINIDLDGNMYLCHNGFSRFERCTTDGAKIAKEAQILFSGIRGRHLQHGKPCLGCAARPVCHEGCPFSPWGEGQAMQCEFMKILGGEVLRFMREVDKFQTTEIDL